MDDSESEMLFKAVKVVVAVKERMTVHDAECGDQAIDGLPNRMAMGPKVAIIPG